MFNNLSTSCSGTNTPWEILPMLAGAFLLGCLLCWLIRKLRSYDNTPDGGNQGRHDYTDYDDHIDNDYQSNGNNHANHLYDGNNSSKTQTYQDEQKSINEAANSSRNTVKRTGSPQAHQSYPVRKISENPKTKTGYSTPKIDDLTKISSIDKNVELLLRGKGIKSYIDLRDADHQKLYSIMDTPNFNVPKNEVETWPHQSSLAAKGEWKKLSDYQSFKDRSRNVSTAKSSHKGSKLNKTKPVSSDKASQTLSSTDSSNENKASKVTPVATAAVASTVASVASSHTKAKEVTETTENQSNNSSTTTTSSVTNKKDDLRKIAGITPEIERTLNKKGIVNFEQLHASDQKDLDKYLVAHTQGSNGSDINTHSLIQQAELAKQGKWDDLDEYQDYLSIKRSQPSAQSLLSKTADDKTQSEILSNKKEIETSAESNSKNADKVVKLSDTKEFDDLKKIEGIGPKIEEVLNTKGIKTFKHLHNSERNALKGYLDNAGPQFKMHEPESWPHQAGMAKRGEWEKLKEYQDRMMSEQGNPNTQNNSKNLTAATTTDSKSTETQDDLTKIEGIGPKIKEVLNSQGIYTFEQLYKTTRNTLKNHLTAAGPQFKMHEPESWPHQAGMANRGEWKKLKEYQDFMVGGRDDIMSLSSANASNAKDSANTNKSKRKHSLTTNYVDDLTKIEGIGPKIEQLLNEAGILNFLQLKESDRDTIKVILDNGGPQFKMHEPKSWPKQAELADAGEWKKLEEYQDILIGGR